MKTIITLSIFLLTSVLFAQDMRQNGFSSLFSDQKANKIGDAITILVIESSQASNKSEKSTGRTSELGFTQKLPISIPGSGITIGSNNVFKGSGFTKTQGIVRTKISATVDSVLANGNLVIKGSRKIIINGEEQTVFIKGIVRISDIAPDNTVLSYNISNAEIIFNGDGAINSSLSPGWLTKFFHWIF
ncbi:MAG TPA: flagellar basal body L-ring protein FlgH [Ignavibacteria bacterium]|nr:flagellar basal body L-ring protein FlgH [Ignavibacteria bacterium]